MLRPARLAVLGAGLIGKMHIEHILAEPEAELAAIVDPAPVSKLLAQEKGVPWFPSFADLLAVEKPEGIIVATPNQLHLPHGMEAIAMKLPVLIEKPITDDIASGTKLVEAAEAAGVPLLVGHYRRHNPIVSKAKEIIESGRLGRIIAVHAACWLMKPDDYFEMSWRREKGAGPVFLNLIHDMDLLRYLCGDVKSVQALESSAVRGNAVEESVVILLRFANGALGTVTLSDTIVAPWSWELTSGENPAYCQTDQSCYYIGGTHGSLAIPKLDVWHHKDKRSWWAPIYVERVPFEPADPLRLQIRHFCRVVRGQEQPRVPGREGLKALQLIVAVKDAARTGELIAIA
jgi:predicted dehydrogenase